MHPGGFVRGPPSESLPRRRTYPYQTGSGQSGAARASQRSTVRIKETSQTSYSSIGRNRLVFSQFHSAGKSDDIVFGKPAQDFMIRGVGNSDRDLLFAQVTSVHDINESPAPFGTAGGSWNRQDGGVFSGPNS